MTNELRIAIAFFALALVVSALMLLNIPVQQRRRRNEKTFTQGQAVLDLQRYINMELKDMGMICHAANYDPVTHIFSAQFTWDDKTKVVGIYMPEVARGVEAHLFAVELVKQMLWVRVRERERNSNSEA